MPLYFAWVFKFSVALCDNSNRSFSKRFNFDSFVYFCLIFLITYQTTSPGLRNTPIPKLGEVEEEVISLQPIGRGIQSLEPGATVETIGGTSFSDSG